MKKRNQSPLLLISTFVSQKYWLICILIFSQTYTVFSQASIEFEVSGSSNKNVPIIKGTSGGVFNDDYDNNTEEFYDYYGFTDRRLGVPFNLHQDDADPTWGNGSISKITFDENVSSLRADPEREGNGTELYIDWEWFENWFENKTGPSAEPTSYKREFDYMYDRGISPLIRPGLDGDDLLNWNNDDQIQDLTSTQYKFRWEYWKTVYAFAYYAAKNYHFTAYETKNEPRDHWKDIRNFKTEDAKTKFLASAVQAAVEDVNRIYNLSLKREIAGPSTAGSYWKHDEDFIKSLRYSNVTPSYGEPGLRYNSGTDYTEDAESASWGYTVISRNDEDIYNTPIPGWQNITQYNYHKYGRRPKDFSNANNFLRGLLDAEGYSDMPIVLTEYNSITSGSAYSAGQDADSYFSAAQLAANTIANYAKSDVGENGGHYVFRFNPTVLNYRASKAYAHGRANIGNSINFVDTIAPFNFGGLSRSGEAYRMFSANQSTSGFTPNYDVSVKSYSGMNEFDATVLQNAMVFLNTEEDMYYIYYAYTTEFDFEKDNNGDNVYVDGQGVYVNKSFDGLVDVTFNVSNLDHISSGSPVIVERINSQINGNISDVTEVSLDKKIHIDGVTHNTVLLFKIPHLEVGESVVETTVFATDDAQISGGVSKKDQNKGSDVTMDARIHPGNSETAIAFLKFDISQINKENLSRAVFNINARTYSQDQSRKVIHAYTVSDNDWNEETITWNNAPGIEGNLEKDVTHINDNFSQEGLGISGELIGTISINSSTMTSYKLDVTDLIKSTEEDSITIYLASVIRTTYDDRLDNINYRGVRMETKESGNSPEILLYTKTALVSLDNQPNYLSGMIDVFPNPVSNKLSLKLKNTSTINEVSVYDLHGNLVWENQKMDVSEMNINVANWSKGVYVLMMKSESVVESKKIILK